MELSQLHNCGLVIAVMEFTSPQAKHPASAGSDESEWPRRWLEAGKHETFVENRMAIASTSGFRSCRLCCVGFSLAEPRWGVARRSAAVHRYSEWNQQQRSDLESLRPRMQRHCLWSDYGAGLVSGAGNSSESSYCHSNGHISRRPEPVRERKCLCRNRSERHRFRFAGEHKRRRGTSATVYRFGHRRH